MLFALEGGLETSDWRTQETRHMAGFSVYW